MADINYTLWPKSLDKYGVLYAYGINYLQIKKSLTQVGNEVVLTITNGDTTYTDKRVIDYYGKCNINMSSYLQSFFTDLSGISEFATTTDVTMTLTIGSTTEATKTCRVVYGCIAPNDDPCPIKQTHHVWSNYPFTYYIMSKAANTLTPIIGNSVDEDNEEQITEAGITAYTLPTGVTELVQVYSGTEASRRHLFIYHSDAVSDNKVYLRWVDRFGCFRYWLFDKGNEEQSDSLVGDAFPVLISETTNGNSIAYYGTRYQGKEMAKSVALVAPLVDRDTFDQLCHLLASPNVCAYDADNEEWLPIVVSAGKGTWERDKHANLQDYEISIVYPTIQTSLL